MPLLIAECKDGGLTRDAKFELRKSRVPQKMPGCSFKFCARIAEPYIENGCKHGLEMNIINTLQDLMEFGVGKQYLYICWSFGLANSISYNCGIKGIPYG